MSHTHTQTQYIRAGVLSVHGTERGAKRMCAYSNNYKCTALPTATYTNMKNRNIKQHNERTRSRMQLSIRLTDVKIEGRQHSNIVNDMRRSTHLYFQCWNWIGKMSSHLWRR